MLGSIRSTILPFAMWTDSSPVHNITAILHLEKSNLIVTGSESGHIIIWNTKPHGNELLPVNYLISHRSKVMTLCLAGSRKHTDIDYFVSFSEDRELGLWDAGNGRSIEFLSNASYDVQSVSSYESQNLKQRLLFCCLQSPEIVIINSMSLSEICTLTCSTSLNMFSTVTSFNISTKDDIIFASAVSGLTSMWILNFADINNDPLFNPKVAATESLEIDLSDPIKISHNPHHTNIFLIISSCKFMIYHADNWSVLCYQDCMRGDYFINGEFISINSILLHCQSGKSLYYKLPPRSDFLHASFGQSSTDLSDNIPNLLCHFREPKKVTMLDHKVTTKISEHGYVIWKGFIDGSICKWDYQENIVEHEVQIFSLSSSWKSMRKKPTNLASLFEDPLTCGPVTSLLYLPDLSLFVLGMYNGSIFITNFESSIGNVFKKGLQSEPQYVKLTGHCGPVLCLIHPCSTMKLPSRITSCNNPRVKPCLQLLKLTHILWSGGEDFSIRIWNMKTEQCLNIFHCHSSPVMVMRLNHLPENAINVCGFSQGLTKAMFNCVGDDDPNSGEIRQLINTSMNAFMVAISEDGGISIISMMRQRLLLYSIEHDSPIKTLGWILDSGYLLLETIKDTVYVWDLSSKTMDRCERNGTAKLLMESCVVTTKVRTTPSSRNIVSGSDMMGRHTLSNLTSYICCQSTPPSNKFIRFQFIKTGVAFRYVPVIILDLTILLNSLDISTQTSTDFYSLLSEIDNPILHGFRNSDVVSNFDTLMMDVTAVNRDMDIKVSLIKIILSRAHVCHKSCQLDSILFKYLDNKTDTIACSIGQVNSKTGAITFNLKDLFKESEETALTIDNILIQLSISNKISNPSQRSRIESSVCTAAANSDNQMDVSSPRFHSFSNTSINFVDYHSSTRLTKLLLAYKTSIIDKHVPMLFKKTGNKARFSDFPEKLTFYTIEKMFHHLIIGILDVSDWISTSAHHILIKVISELSSQEIQNYLLIMRTILLPDLDHYTSEGALSFSARIHAYLHRFSDQSFLASDWIWWYSMNGIKNDQDKKNLTKIQIKALVYLALIGTYLQSDDSTKFTDEVKLFSKVFSLDNFFLARITCDFLLDLLTINVLTVKRTTNRLISLAMLCLSVGFKVWEPYLNSSTLISQLLEFTDDDLDSSDGDNDGKNCFLLSSVANQSLLCIALARPLVFIMVCYREMLRQQNAQSHHGTMATSSSSHSLERQKSTPVLTSSYDTEFVKKQLNKTILKKHIIFPILEELFDCRTDSVCELLPEIVELYLSSIDRFNQKEVDLQHLLYPVIRFTSVAIHTSSGHIAVGSSNGSLALFDPKIGKYFTSAAHRKPIKFTLFSNDARYLATYSIVEGMVKIWQISHTGLFHIGSSSYHVKNVASHIVPSIEHMIQSIERGTTSDFFDGSIKLKKMKSFKKSKSQGDKPSNVTSNESGLGLNWHSDNKTLSIHLNGRALRNFKL